MEHVILGIAGSPRRNGNSEKLLDSALAGAAQACPQATVRKLVLNEMHIIPCQNCGYCSGTGSCRFVDDDMKDIYQYLYESDRFVIASPIFFTSVTAQLKAMIDRCQATWSRKYLLKQRHVNEDRKALFLSCGGFHHEKFFQCARQVVSSWCAVEDVELAAGLFYHSIDKLGDVEKHPTALADALAAGKSLLS